MFGSNLALDRAAEVSARERDAGIARARSAVKAQGSDTCLDCGRPIPRARRLAAPFAKRCIECEEVRERE